MSTRSSRYITALWVETSILFSKEVTLTAPPPNPELKTCAEPSLETLTYLMLLPCSLTILATHTLGIEDNKHLRDMIEYIHPHHCFQGLHLGFLIASLIMHLSKSLLKRRVTASDGECQMDFSAAPPSLRVCTTPLGNHCKNLRTAPHPCPSNWCKQILTLIIIPAPSYSKKLSAELESIV